MLVIIGFHCRHPYLADLTAHSFPRGEGGRKYSTPRIVAVSKRVVSHYIQTKLPFCLTSVSFQSNKPIDYANWIFQPFLLGLTRQSHSHIKAKVDHLSSKDFEPTTKERACEQRSTNATWPTHFTSLVTHTKYFSTHMV